MTAEDVKISALKKCLGKKTEVLAFGLVYAGKLTKVDLRAGTIQIEDGKDYVVLEIERIEFFKDLSAPRRRNPSHK